MVGAVVVDAGEIERIADIGLGIEARAEPADAAQQLQLRVLAQRRRVDGVDVIQDGPEGLISLVEVAAGTPGDLAFHAEVPPEERITADAEKGAAPDGLRAVIAGGAGRRWRGDRAYAKSDVDLRLLVLRRGRQADQDKREKRECAKILHSSLL